MNGIPLSIKKEGFSMNGMEIRKRIIANNKLIAEQPHNIFVLNKKIQELIEDNRRLQEICPHEFDETGYCIYCDKEYK